MTFVPTEPEEPEWFKRRSEKEKLMISAGMAIVVAIVAMTLTFCVVVPQAEIALSRVPDCPTVTNETYHLGSNSTWCEPVPNGTGYRMSKKLWENAVT